MRLSVFTSAVYILFSTLHLQAQTSSYQYVFNKKDTLIKKIDVFGSLNHQHEDFFYKAFSYQGVETGLIINDKINVGLFVSAFASNLQVRINDNPQFVTSWKCGLMVGEICHSEKMIHTGWQLSAGYFSLKVNNKQLTVFSNSESMIKVEGMILEPQIYSEINILKWFKFRTGLAYSFYSFEDHKQVTKDDLNNVSLNFSFIFLK